MTTKEARSEERFINLAGALGILIDYKILVAIVTACFLVAAMIYLQLTPPIYQADSLIQIESKKSGLAGIERLTEMQAVSDSNAEMELIKSRFVLGKAVDRLQVTIYAEAQEYPYIGNYMIRRFERRHRDQIAAGPKFISDASQYNWGGARIHIAQMEVQDNWIGITFTLVAGKDGAYQLMYGDNRLLLSGTVGQKVEKDGVFLLVDRLVCNPGTHFLVRKNPRLQTINAVRGALTVIERGKRGGMVNLTYQNKNSAFAVSLLNEITNQYLYQNIERTSAEAANSLRFVREQLPQLREEVTKATAALNAYQVNSKSVDISTETKAVLDQIVKAEMALSEMRLKQVDIATRFTREHPSYQILLTQMEEIEGNKKELEKKVETLPETQQTLLRLSRDMDVSMRVYTQLLQTEQQLDVIRAGTVGNIRIIDVAEFSKVGPKNGFIMTLAWIAGLFAGACLAWIHVLLTRGVENPEDIEKLGLTVNAIIPYSSLQVQSERGRTKTTLLPLLALSHPTDPAVEAIRTLRTSIYFIMQETRNNILMISGPSPLVGKTFVSANLAVTMAQADKKVLVIDADMRKGYMHCYFDVSLKNVGLSSVLQKKATLKDSITRTAIPGLDFMSRGPVPENPSELLLNPLLAQIFKQLSANYDFVIIDTPPIMAVADALIVSKLSGANFIVSRFSKNPIGEVQATMKRFEANGVKLDGAVLNASQRRALADYGYQKYSYGNYQYSYNSDVDEIKKRSSFGEAIRARRDAFLNRNDT
jgi:tyrosine-protein kinase Etk/Wzc